MADLTIFLTTVRLKRMTFEHIYIYIYIHTSENIYIYIYMHKRKLNLKWDKHKKKKGMYFYCGSSSHSHCTFLKQKYQQINLVVHYNKHLAIPYTYISCDLLLKSI